MASIKLIFVILPQDLVSTLGKIAINFVVVIVIILRKDVKMFKKLMNSKRKIKQLEKRLGELTFENRNLKAQRDAALKSLEIQLNMSTTALQQCNPFTNQHSLMLRYQNDAINKVTDGNGLLGMDYVGPSHSYRPYYGTKIEKQSKCRCESE